MTASGRTADAAGAERAAAVFALLANPTRLRLLLALADGEAHVRDLETRLGLAQSLVSTHLARLRAAGLVRGRRDPPRVYYALDQAGWEAAAAAVRAFIFLENGS